MVLLWNPDFFHQFCPLVLDKKFCEGGFWTLGDAEQNMLRGALVRKVNATCPDCPAGIDLSQANYSVGVFARSMLASCEQVGQTIFNITDLSPARPAHTMTCGVLRWSITMPAWAACPLPSNAPGLTAGRWTGQTSPRSWTRPAREQSGMWKISAAC